MRTGCILSRHRVRLGATLLLVMAQAASAVSAADLLNEPVLMEQFDAGMAVGKRVNSYGWELRGASLVPSGRWGRSLQLDAGTSAELTPAQPVQAEGGTLSLWIHPLWKEGEVRSHTFVSMAWNDAKHSYLALSQGWWEPDGAERFYFIVSNQESMHCSVPRRLPPAVWTMVTAVWKSGPQGYCALFFNGQSIAQFSQPFDGRYENRGPLLFGSDAATTQARGRAADALVDEVALYTEPLSDRDVQRLYRMQEKDPQAAARKWDWLERGLALPQRSLYSATGVRMESRVIFDEDLRWATSREETDRILARVKAAGFNVYVPCVWHGNGTYYPSALAEADPAVASRIASEDPLAYLIERAHALGIEIHPWFTVVRRENDRRPHFYDAGTPGGAYDIHRPEFRRYIVDLMADVVQRYDVDGINLDYIRAMGICTSPSCRKDYEQASGSRFWADYALRVVVGSARARLERWQDDAVRDIVEGFARRAKRLKPHVVISVDGHPYPSGKPRPLDGRHETRWLNEGLIDIVFVMDYGEVIDDDNHEAVRRELRNPERLVVIFGNYDRLNRREPVIPRRGELIAKYAAYAQRKWPSRAVAFYLYWQMNDEQVSALRNGPFREPAVPSWRPPDSVRTFGLSRTTARPAG
jgi:glycosyl hydrolase family 10/concanavalin A-like lectin/glucanase superfamily protein